MGAKATRADMTKAMHSEVLANLNEPKYVSPIHGLCMFDPIAKIGPSFAAQWLLWKAPAFGIPQLWVFGLRGSQISYSGKFLKLFNAMKVDSKDLGISNAWDLDRILSVPIMLPALQRSLHTDLFAGLFEWCLVPESFFFTSLQWSNASEILEKGFCHGEIPFHGSSIHQSHEHILAQLQILRISFAKPPVPAVGFWGICYDFWRSRCV